MKYATKEILGHFLSEFESLLEKRSELSIHPFLKDFMVREELISIIRSCAEEVTWEKLDMANAPIEKLWNLIADDRIVLSYYIQQWRKETQAREALTPESVQDTLDKLSAQTSYLAFKPLEAWDKYDCSNYKSLLLKSGKVKCLYGIYFRYISQDKVESVTSHPNRFFDTWSEANTYLQARIQQGKCKENEVHILNVYRAL